MAKYDECFKLRVVQQFLDGKAGVKAIAKQSGLAHAMVRRWVESFQRHGANGLKKKFSHYSAEFKLSVLQHIWDNELSYGQAAIHFNIRNASVLGVWERSFRSGGLDALQPRPRGRPGKSKMSAPTIKTETPPEDDKRSREELLAEVGQLRMEVAYLKKLRALVQAQQKATPAKKRK
jgi:transposase